MYDDITTGIIRDRAQTNLAAASAARQARAARRARRAQRRLAKPTAEVRPVALVGKPTGEPVLVNGAARPAHVRGLRAFATWLSTAQL
ncbi:hypothetical protein [uncultured Jatrophihabitans sp.]|uniref:hypothetical protein n=1 Tax=uncultured Jatrophihabitans sp. TaxID=1610747 RepID=UPI0035CBD127